jgi:methionyl-tRNA formyltransferase
MNIIFMGTPQFAVPSLNILLKSHHKISAVVTVPDKKQGRGQKVAQSDVKKFALENNLNILQPEKLKDENFISEIKTLNPDLIIVVAFRILPKEVYSMPKFGSFNLHASLLPKYRGAAPINWAIINGEKETGVTTFFLKDKVDTGSIIMQNYCDITEHDDAGTLHDKLMELGALTVYSTVNLIELSGGNPPVQNQNDTEATPAPKIFKDDCVINWNEPAKAVYNFIRGLSPYPCAFTTHNNKVIKIYKTNLTGLKAEKQGKLYSADNKIYVSCGDKQLEITELQLEGKKRMSAGEFVNGYRNLLE